MTPLQKASFERNYLILRIRGMVSVASSPLLKKESKEALLQAVDFMLEDLKAETHTNRVKRFKQERLSGKT